MNFQTLTMTITIAVSVASLRAAELRVRPECRPSGTLVVLGDVAEIYAQDKEQVERLARVELFPTPGRGQQRFLRVREVLEILDLRSVDLTDCRISGASLVTIHGPAAPAKPLSPPAAPSRPSEPPPVRPEPVVLAVAAARPVERGQVIQASDVQLVPMPARQANDHLLHELEFAVGQEAARPFAPGQPIDSRSLRAPLLVRRREPVHVTVFAPGVRLATQGVAWEDGSAGDWVPVETPQSPEKIRARVVGPKQVEVYVNVPEPDRFDATKDPTRETASEKQSRGKPNAVGWDKR